MQQNCGMQHDDLLLGIQLIVLERGKECELLRSRGKQ